MTHFNLQFRFVRHLFTSLFLGLGCHWAPAETTPTNTVHRTSEVVVSATRIPEEPSKTGSSVSVIPEETLRHRRPFQTAEAMRGEPGLDAGVEVNNATGAQGGVSQVSIRGMPASRTMVTVDGLRFNRPIDGIANLSDLPPLLTGDIEILRGPQSSLYGSEAQGGVITVASPQGTGDPSGGLSYEMGTFNTRRERLFTQGKQGAFDWNVEGYRQDSDQERPNNNFRQSAAAGRFGYDLADTLRLDLGTRWTDYTVGAPSGINGFGSNDPDNRLIRRLSLISPSLKASPVDFWDTTLTLGYLGVGQRFELPPQAFVNHSESLQLHWQNTLQTAEWNTVITGIEARNEHTTTEASSGLNVFNRATDSYYLMDLIRLHDRWGLTLSGRLDNNEGFRDAKTYRASSFYEIPVVDTVMHSSFGTAFRSPTISELQPLFGASSGANAALIPETTEGWDVGFRQPLFGGSAELDATYFYNNTINLISSDQNFVFQNISEIRSEGAEVSYDWKALKQLRFRGTFTLTSTTSKDPRFPGNDLPRTPRYSASWTTWWTPVQGLDLSILYNYSGPSFNNATNTQELSDFHRLDLYAEYAFQDHWKLFGRVENALGYRYQQAGGFPAVGRTFYAGAEFNY